ncbi:MAG: methyltransferase domain-containing protein [Planctomycetota bacterium]|nr:methyltransferase domain-containing protein [Planctomycetota bacterium]
MSGRLCVFQMHHTDAVDGLERLNAVEKARASGIFDKVVLAAADVPENDGLDVWAERWGVDIFRGAEHDVARRILDCAQIADCDRIARALVWWFFIDLSLVENMLDELDRTRADYVNLPRDFDIRFGADVFRIELLEKVLAALEDPGDRERYQTNPWGLVETSPERFDVRTFERVPAYGEGTFERVRRDMKTLWPERFDGAETPLYPYRIASRVMKEWGRALDLACGLGAGTALLAEKGRALGVDRSEEAVAAARERHGERAEFLAGDAFALDLPAEGFDLIASIHTMEHVADDRGFLELLQRWLAPEGRLVLEVPLRTARPFEGIETPLSPGHVREYATGELLELVAERFTVLETYGVNRGSYLDVSRARSAVLIVAGK